MKQALDYAFGGGCDAKMQDVAGVAAAAQYAGDSLTRYIVEDGSVSTDVLDRDGLRAWVEGADPESGIHRGRDLPSPDADLVLDATINAPKSFSIAAMLDPEVAEAFDDLHDRLRERTILSWQSNLNARRGAAGAIREELSRIEVVELRHERSRSLDPHKHRHLWLNMKVRGRDGRWSNIDSRVALKMQTLINAEGDLAARTDSEWVNLLASKGYTLNTDGEIAQLAHLVRPLSRRSNQIEANKVAKLAEWRTENPGQEPGHQVLMSIDQWAWAHGRPNKPGAVDEKSWADLVRAEMVAIDANVAGQGVRQPATVSVVEVAELDRDLLAARAVVDADKRSSASGGRFSMFDVRAGATRAVAASGVVAERVMLDELLEDIVERAVGEGTFSVLEGTRAVPAQVKGLMATATVQVKVELADRFAALSLVGDVVPVDAIGDVAAGVLDGGRRLDGGQCEAAGAIAGTDRLVTVTGPAGTGKTTMLKVARQALLNQGRALVVVAPTKKAASVAGRETGAVSSSLHALLVDHGWQFGQDASGREVWRQLQLGEVNPVTGHIFDGPRKYQLRAGDRVVVDEAGMVDLDTARALAIIAEQSGAGIAMVGDHLQAMPVGHSGAMAIAKQHSSAVVELCAVHRFTDAAYGALSLRLREPGTDEEAASVARELADGGHVQLVANEQAVRDHLVGRYFEYSRRGQSVALITATNDEAGQVNEAIQQKRLDLGHLNAEMMAHGQDEQAVYVGDVVQTRRNDAAAGVENRAVWTVRQIRADGVELGSVDSPGGIRTVSRDYFAEHVHLAYASTVHGIQGETTDAAVVAGGVDAAGLYVGMTRGRTHNEVVLTAGTTEQAKDELVATMRRGVPEVTVGESRQAAQTELSRAARTPIDRDLTPAPWTESKARPFGHVLDVEKHIVAASVRQPQLRKELSDVSDRLARDRRTLTEVGVRLAKRESLNHQAIVTGKPVVPVDDLATARDRLLERIETNFARRTQLTQGYTRISRDVDNGRAEVALRDRLPAEMRRVEERARQSRIAQFRQSGQPDLNTPTPNTRGAGLS